jgi:hypothetical protein
MVLKMYELLNIFETIYGFPISHLKSEFETIKWHQIWCYHKKIEKNDL